MARVALVRRVNRETAAILAAALALCGAAFLALIAPSAQAQDLVEVQPEGASGIELGATIEDLRTSLDDSLVVGEEQTVFDSQLGWPIELDGETLAWVASLDGSGRIDVIALLDDRYRTTDGVGPGSTVGQTRSAYGAARTRSTAPGPWPEVVEFVNGPEGFVFVTSLDGRDKSGLYSDRRTTSVALNPSKLIVAMLLGCADADCQALLGFGDDDASPAGSADGPPLALARTGVETRLLTVAMYLVGGGCVATAGARRFSPAC